MNRKKVMLLVGIVLGGSALIAMFASLSAWKDSRRADTLSQQATSTPSTETPLTPVPFETEHIVGSYYNIDMEYPKNVDNRLGDIQSYVDSIRTQFMDMVPKTDEEAAYIGLTKDRSYSLLMTTAVSTSSSSITYVLTTYMDTGGAHGGTFITTYTYDRSGKKVEINPTVLPQLSEAAQVYLIKHLGEDANEMTIKEGTAPKIENWNTWFVEGDNITFVFQQYQVGPYVLGLQEFTVPIQQYDNLFL